MPDFVAGFASRYQGAADALARAFAVPEGFAATDPGSDRSASRPRPRSFSPQANDGPRHFHPADPDANPTEGWDPFDPHPTDQAEASTPAGFVDPVAAAREAGYTEGFAAATAAAADATTRNTALVEQLSAALTAAGYVDRERLAQQLRDTVLHIVGRVIGDAGVAPDLLADRIAAAADLIADSAESAILRLHPDDVALVEGKLPKTLFPVGDAGVARGGFVLESASTIVEDNPGLWLEQLAAAIERVAVPPPC